MTPLEANRKSLADDCSRVRAALEDIRSASRLTIKEQKILRCIGLGMADQEIADYLGISKGTTHVHIGRIHDKLVISSRPRLAVVANKVIERENNE
jgi:DNA-binding CsgD family transcriptional regulator